MTGDEVGVIPPGAGGVGEANRPVLFLLVINGLREQALRGRCEQQHGREGRGRRRGEPRSPDSVPHFDASI